MATRLNPLDHPILFSGPIGAPVAPERLAQIPLAMLLVSVLKPRVIVDVDPAAGNLFLACCRAVHLLRLPTQCYAVEYSEDPARQPGTALRDALEPAYGSFAHWMRASRHAGRSQWAAGNVDLLHLGRGATADELLSRFETWLPLLSPAGVVVADIAAWEPDNAGAPAFWKHARARYKNLEIGGRCGIGLFSASPTPTPEVQCLLDLNGHDPVALRDLVHQMGRTMVPGSPPAPPQVAQAIDDQNETSQLRQQLATLNQTLRDQSEHIEMLEAQRHLLLSRETELRERFLEAHSQLTDRDDAMMLVTQERKIIAERDEGIAWLRGELALAQEEITRIKGTAAWRLIDFYRSLRRRVKAIITGRR